MAGMLPGVECARRRRLRQGGSSSGAAEAPCGTRRPSFCLYAGGHDHAHLGSAAASKERISSVCKEMMARAWTLDTNAREAKERLDQKLRGQRESLVKRHQSTGTVRPPTAKPHPNATSTSGGSNLQHSATTAAPWVLQREVLSKPANVGGAARRRRFSWSLLGRRRPPPASDSEASECAVCLEELQVGDVLVHLPCAHRFHWSCGVPWVQAASRCPVCRALVHLAPN
ncbi:E3 ubiquitin-protein ligase RNF115-like isoform X2 [Panicum virgatum]|uniref:E3 ubiquitin-protein ligase RNF115-like isoform X2 n=1 Tax=Panicum virgatum TaxID=38727 RepID=UPI0019D65031|nr:E3 ubiquitin-protein ligase RNF115-like isoform X2 [Panicum virgatum]